MYRSSSSSDVNYSRYAYLYLENELSIPTGATITGLSWYLANAASPTITATFDIYLQNTTATSVSSGSTWGSLALGATHVYDENVQDWTEAVGWVDFPLDSSFVYTGDNLKLLTDWFISSSIWGTSSNGAFNWFYDAGLPGLGIGSADDTNPPPTLGAGTTGIHASAGRPTLRIIYEYDTLSEDLLPVNLLAPAEFSCFGPGTSVTVQLTNNGQATIDFSSNPADLHVDITGPDTYSTTIPLTFGTIAPGGFRNVSFGSSLDMTAGGTYTFTFITDYTGDSNPSNDTLVVAREVPLVESVPTPVYDFTGYTSSLNDLYPSWTERTGLAPSYGNSLWAGESFIRNGSHPNGTSASTRIYASNENHWIVGPEIVPSSDDYLYYDIAMTQHLSTAAGSLGADDLFRVMILTNCGTSVSSIKTYNNSSSISNVGQLDSVSLAAYAGQEIQFAFYSSSGSAANAEDVDIYIDNVQVREPAAPVTTRDIGVSALASPNPTASCLGASEDLIVYVKNMATQPIDFATNNVLVFANISGAGNQNLIQILNSGALNSGDSLAFTVSSSVNFSAFGTYNISVYTQLSGDEDVTNDTLNAVVNHVPLSVETLPLDPLNFAGYNGSNLSTLYPSWQEGNGVFTPNLGDSPWTFRSFGNSGSSSNGVSAVVNLSGNSTFAWIVSPQFTATANTVLIYDYALTQALASTSATLGSDDMVEVLVSTDCGASYSVLKSFDSASTISPVGATDTLFLSSYSGQDILIAFKGTTGVVNDAVDVDFFLDNISIGDLLAVDLTVVDVSAPVEDAFGCYSSMEPLAVVLQNMGTQVVDFGQTNALVLGNITGASTQSFIMNVNSGTLAPFDTMTVLISSMANFTAGGTHTIEAIVQLGGDQSSVNDTLTEDLVASALLAALTDTLTFTGYGTTGSLGDTYPDWREGIGVLSPTIAESDWTGYDFANNSGESDAARLTIGDSTSAWLLSPRFIVGANDHVKYRAALTEEASMFEGDLALGAFVGMGVSTDCGLSFTPLKIYNDFVSPNNIGQTDYFSLDAYVGQEVILGVFGAGSMMPGSEPVDFFIDDLHIGDAPMVDVMVLPFTSPDIVPGGCYSSQEYFTVPITNLGVSTIDFSMTNALISLEVTGNNTGFQSVLHPINTGILATGDTMYVAVSQPLNLSATDVYSIAISLILAADEATINNEIGGELVARSISSLPLPTMDFASFATSDLNDSYEDWGEAMGNPPMLGNSDWASGDFGNDAGHPSGQAAMLQLNGVSNGSWLISPAFNVQFHTKLIYEYALTATGTSNPASLGAGQEFGVYVSTDCGESFSLLRQYDSNSTISATGQRDTLDLSAYTTLDVLIGFYGVVTSNPSGQDVELSLDNIQIGRVLANDIAISEILLPESGCNLGIVPIDVVICNNGSVVQSDLNVYSTTTSDPIVLPGPFYPGMCDTVNLGTIPLENGGTISFSVYAALPGDQVSSNDNATVVAAFPAPIEGPEVQDAIACSPSSMMLSVTNSSPSGISWYDAPVGGNLVGVGDTLMTPVISTTTPYYAQLNEGLGDYSVGLADNTQGGGGTYSFFADGLVFSVFRELVLDSVTVYPLDSGLIRVVLKSASGTTLDTASLNYTGSGGAVRVPLGFMIPIGTDYSLTLEGSTITGAFRNNSGASYPYEITDLISITQTVNNLADFYYYFYDWAISADQCESKRTAAYARIARDVFEPNETFLDATPLPLIGVNQNAYICDGVDSDWFTFAVPQDKRNFRITLSNLDDNLDMELYDPALSLMDLGINPDNSDEVFTKNSVLAGTYYVRIYGASDYIASAGYTLRLLLSADALNVSGSPKEDNPKEELTMELLEAWEESIQVYPNPASDYFSVSLTMEAAAEVELTIRDVLGRELHTETKKAEVGDNLWDINTEGLSSALYFVELRWGDHSYTQRLQISK